MPFKDHESRMSQEFFPFLRGGGGISGSTIAFYKDSVFVDPFEYLHHDNVALVLGG
jgi:hypothetical protein